MAVNLSKTEFHTPKTYGELDVCDGLAVYPGAVARAGVAMNHMPFALLDWAPQMLGWRFHIRVDGGFAAGICGPAYATSVTLEATEQESEDLDVVLHGSETVGGMVVGLVLTLNIGLEVEKYHTSAHWVSDGWHSHLEWEHHWKRLAKTRFDLQIDVAKIIVDKLLKKLLGAAIAPGPARAQPLPKHTGLSSLHQRFNALAAEAGTDLHPTWSISMDLVQLTGTVLTGPEFGEMVQVLNKFGIALRIGPRFSFGLPVSIELMGLELPEGTYEFDRSTQVPAGEDGSRLTARRRSATSNVAAGDARLRLKHVVQQEFGFDVHAHFQVLKLGKLSRALPKIQLLDFLGVTGGDTYEHVLTSAMGAVAAASYGADPDGADCSCAYEVTLEPVEA